MDGKPCHGKVEDAIDDHHPTRSAPVDFGQLRHEYRLQPRVLERADTASPDYKHQQSGGLEPGLFVLFRTRLPVSIVD